MNLAPNGQPSNLTPEQYRLVRTPAFKKWFGDWENSPETSSKVVDENGEPKVMYHSTDSTFNEFKPSWRGVIFFANTKTGSKKGSVQGSSRTIEVFLNSRKIKGNKKMGIYFGDVENSKYQNKIKREGFDGIYVRDEAKGTIAIFNSNQIKLADGTNTTFDSNNPDIRFGGGGNVLLAPNGKPSNLTPEQYRLVRTPAFKKWFGDWENSPETASKVVDEETKEPKVMYHGSKNDFTIFNPKAEAINRRQNFEGFYFTGNKNRAESYSNIKLFEVFINIRNPLNRHLGEHLPSYKSLNYIREKYKGDFNKEYLEEKMFQLQRTGRNSFIDGEDMTKILIMDDYDGVFDGSFDYGDTVAFNSTQIKLADGTNTTFDSNNPDIRYKNGGGLSNLNIDGYIFDLDKDNSIENEKVFKINDNKGDSIGKIYIVDKNGAYHIENVRLNKERTGVGYDIYKKLISILDKPIKSGEVQNEKAKGLWDKLVKEGLAKKEGNGYVSNSPEYKNGGLTMKKPKAKLLAPNGKRKSDKYLFDGGELNDFVLYHGTGNAKKVIQALKDGSFRFYKSAGVEKGMYLTSNKKLALEYANDSQNTLRKGEDIGILEIRFNKIPNFKKYNNYGEQYYDEIKPNYNPKESSIEYTKDLISNNYDGYSIGDVYLLFKEKIDLIDVNKTSIIRYELGGEITLTTEQVEKKLGRKLHWWNDDVVSINGIEYKKVFLRPEYKRL